jgi:hypothetical protein
MTIILVFVQKTQNLSWTTKFESNFVRKSKVWFFSIPKSAPIYIARNMEHVTTVLTIYQCMSCRPICKFSVRNSNIRHTCF